MPDWILLVEAGIILILLGFFAIAVGIMLSAREDEEKGENPAVHREVGEKRVRGGGVILIGPVPIVFGTDKRFALIAMILAITLMLLAIIFLK